MFWVRHGIGYQSIFVWICAAFAIKLCPLFRCVRSQAFSYGNGASHGLSSLSMQKFNHRSIGNCLRFLDCIYQVSFFFIFFFFNGFYSENWPIEFLAKWNRTWCAACSRSSSTICQHLKNTQQCLWKCSPCGMNDAANTIRLRQQPMLACKQAKKRNAWQWLFSRAYLTLWLDE